MEQITITTEQRAEVARCIQAKIMELQQRRRRILRRMSEARPWRLNEARIFNGRGRRLDRLADLLRNFED